MADRGASPLRGSELVLRGGVSLAARRLVGQAHSERCRVQLLGAQAAIDASGLDGLAVEQTLERVAQGLAALVEGFAHDTLQQQRVLGWVGLFTRRPPGIEQRGYALSSTSFTAGLLFIT